MSQKVKIVITGDAKSAEKAFRKASAAAEKSMKLIAAAGAAAAVAFTAYSIKAASDFSSAVSDLSAITGATGDELKFLSDQAREFGATTTLTASQSAEAFKLIASAKPDLLANGAALAEVTRQTITLAEASGVQLSAAANTVGSALNQFAAEADEAARFVNVLAAGSKFGAASVDDVSMALKISGTVAKSTGLSFEETNAAIQAMGAVALKGSEAGTGLRGVLLKLASQSRDEFNPEIVGFTQSMKNLAAANLSTTEKTKLFGLESITAANALIGQADSLDTLTGKLTGTSVALEQARIRNNNLEGDVRRQISAFESLAITSGNILTPSLRVLTQGFTQITAEMDASLKAASAVQSEMDSLTIGFAQAADVIGNAAHGIALPFLVVGDAIGAVAAQISFLADGEFKLAIKAGEAGFDSMKQRLLDASDPVISSRFENIARQIIATNAAAVSDPSTTPGISTASPSDMDPVTGEATADIDQKLTDRLLRIETSLLTEEERLQQSYWNRAAITAEAVGNDLITEQRGMEILGGLQAQFEASKRKALTDSAKFALAVQKGETKGILSGAAQMTAGLAQHNRAAFEANKLFAGGQVLVDGVVAVQKAASASPFPANVPGVIFETLSAAGRLAAVKSASFGGGGSIPTSQGGSAGGVPSQQVPIASAPSATPAESVSSQGSTYQLFFQGNVLSKDFIENDVVATLQDLDRNGDIQIISPTGRNAQEIRDAA